MIYLGLSIAFTCVLYLIFKAFSHFNIDNIQAIVINYFVAFAVGLLFFKPEISINELYHKSWLLGAFLLGLIFIVIFNLLALTSQRNGITVASVATKMSLVIPVVFGIVIYNETTSPIKIIGISLALIAVYLVSASQNGQKVVFRKNLLLPLLVFIGSGIIDTSIKFIESHYVSAEDVPLFSAFIFGFAAFFGVLYFLLQIIKGQLIFKLKNIIAGVVLGVPNYFSIYFIIKALRIQGLESATIFTINNVGVVVITSLLGILVYNEKLNLNKGFGIALAVISIILVSQSAS